MYHKITEDTQKRYRFFFFNFYIRENCVVNKVQVKTQNISYSVFWSRFRAREMQLGLPFFSKNFFPLVYISFL